MSTCRWSVTRRLVVVEGVADLLRRKRDAVGAEVDRDGDGKMSLKLKPPSRAWQREVVAAQRHGDRVDELGRGGRRRRSRASCGSRPAGTVGEIEAGSGVGLRTCRRGSSSPLRPESDAVENVTVYVLPLSVMFAVPLKRRKRLDGGLRAQRRSSRPRVRSSSRCAAVRVRQLEGAARRVDAERAGRRRWRASMWISKAVSFGATPEVPRRAGRR